jgi:acyl dehydratase
VVQDAGFQAAHRIGDTIRVKVTIKGKRAHKMPAHGIVSELLEVTNQRPETVPVCEHLLLVKMKGA